MASQSILAQERARGFREGVEQMSMVCWDDAFDSGRLEAQREADGAARRWFMFGVALGIAIAVLIGAFF